MNTNILADNSSRSHIQQEWARWRLQEGKFPDMIKWWEKYVERKIHFLFNQEETARLYIYHPEGP
jgi:hypothetical protein